MAGSPFLTTLLTPPPLRDGLVARPRLIRALEQAGAGTLTLVVAPAGYGKTTLLSAWAASLRARHTVAPAAFADAEPAQSTTRSAHICQVAWLTLDRDANDPARFWGALIAALRQAHPALHASLEPSAAALVALLNDLATHCGPLTLVLDDYQTIGDPRIQRAMAFAVEHLPRSLRLVIASRVMPALPLARLRARGHLHELGPDDLRCTVGEATTFLRATMGLPIAAVEAELLTTRAEGWFASLQLAALALRRQPDLPAAIRTFAGTQRLIADYLIDEVLDQQPPAVQAFLLRTSVLSRLCGALCDAVLGDWRLELSDCASSAQSPIADRQSRSILEQLERCNLFLVPLDGQRRWYRYHQLFAELLRDQLARRTPTLAPMLHRRAAAWYTAQGLLPDAIEHALAAGDHAQAADLIGQTADALWLRGELATLGRWLDLLPHVLLLQQPILVLMRFWTLLNNGQVLAATATLADAEQRLSGRAGEPATDAASGHAQAMAATRDELAVLLASSRVLLAFTQEPALPVLPALGDDLARWHWLTVLHIGFAAWSSGALAVARRALRQALTHPQAVAGTQPLLAQCYLADLDRQAGRLAQAAQGYQLLLDDPAGTGQPRPPVLSYALLGKIAYACNDLDRAAACISAGAELARSGGKTDVILEAQIAMAWVQQARGDAAEARTTMEGAVQTAQRWQIPVYRAITLAQQARLALAQGEVAAAGRWARTCGLKLEEVGGGPREVMYLILARVLLALGQCDEALAWLARIHAEAQAAGRVGRAIEALALRALAQQARGDGEQAQASLEAALVAAEPAGYVRLFVDAGTLMRLLIANGRRQMAQRAGSPDAQWLLASVDLLLAAFPEGRSQTADRTRSNGSGNRPSPSQHRPSELAEPLTPRELAVLRNVAGGLSNRAIAAQLSLAAGTVKWYLEQVYGKLGVHNRIEAVAQARTLRLIE
jgi:ATP/maltotriose-dependent transcriptional regulator MalT